MNILFVSGVAPVVQDMAAARNLYSNTFGIPLQGDDYPSTDKLAGIRHFGVWSIEGVSESCFGTSTWPAEIPAPSATIEFEVDDVDNAAAELEAAGHRLLRAAGEEPWGQRVARLLTNDGLLLAVTHTPWMQA